MIYGILSTIAFIMILPFWLVAGIFNPKLVAGFREKCGFYKQAKSGMENEKWIKREKGKGKRGKEYPPSKSKILVPPQGRDNFSTFRLFDYSTSSHFSPLTSHSEKPTLVFYGVSVGEVIAIENLIKKTRENFPDINIILLTGTKTGQEIAHKKLGEVCNFISYFPFDFPFCIENMLKNLNPTAVFVAETELWPNFARIMNKKNIPLFIINGRISDRTYKSYKKLSFFFGPILKKYTNIYTQSRQDNDKLISIGANPETTTVMGNLKFDIKKPDVSNLMFKKNPPDKIILAGSTHSGEDEIILEVFKELKKDIPNLKLIIAPRHPERNESVFNLVKNRGIECIKRSEILNAPHPKPSPSRGEGANSPALLPSCLLLDTMGELGKFYSVCDVAFIGGSFNQTGGHNPLEATIFNKPVVSGSSIHNFKDIYAILTSSDAGKIVKTKEELTQHLRKLLTDEKFYQKASKDCENVFEENKGALDFVLKVLQTLV
ncbi:MAG: 3-deoxy-D-manno-octulosonic acid transferase [Candidatus Gastranaerophilales bacterium]|nr:3-deoxy-D-manno-octulosonic acid transferase [Candidatus Gastranaerophilales bacterium]